MNAHVANASVKLEASNRAHLVAWAFVRGILAVAHQRAISALLIVACAFGLQDGRRPPRPPRRGRDDTELVTPAA
jgi:hypothetical protein